MIDTNIITTILDIIFIIISTIFVVILRYKYYDEIYGKNRSLQFFLILFGTIFLILFLLLRIVGIPNITTNNAEIYFNNAINVILALFAGFGIIFSILGGSLYAYMETHPFELTPKQEQNFTEKAKPYKSSLKKQFLVSFIFLIIIVASIFVSFLLPLSYYFK